LGQVRVREVSSSEIRLSLDDLAQLEILFESKWQRPPTPEEFNFLVEDRIREEILYREALAMGLDKGDTIVKRHMAQKMKFLAEDVVAIPLLTLLIERSNGVIFGTFSVINLFRERPNPA